MCVVRVKWRNRTVINIYRVTPAPPRTFSPSSYMSEAHARAPVRAHNISRRVPCKDRALLRLLPHTQRARVAAHRRRRCSSPGSTLRTHSTTQRSQTYAPALLVSRQSPMVTVRKRCAAGARQGMSWRGAGWRSYPPVNPRSSPQLGLLLPPAPKPTRTCEHRPGEPRHYQFRHVS